MGRFDALTQIEESQTPLKPSLEGSSNTSNTYQVPITKSQSEIDKKDDTTVLLANQQTSKPESKKSSLLANQQTSKSVNQQTSKLANQQTSNILAVNLSTKEKKKYGTYLREDSISAIQVYAIQSKQKDHEVLQQAVDEFFKRLK